MVQLVECHAGAKCSFTGTGAVLVTANTGSIGTITGARLPEVTACAGATCSLTGTGGVSVTPHTPSLELVLQDFRQVLEPRYRSHEQALCR